MCTVVVRVDIQVDVRALRSGTGNPKKRWPISSAGGRLLARFGHAVTIAACPLSGMNRPCHRYKRSHCDKSKFRARNGFTIAPRHVDRVHMPGWRRGRELAAGCAMTCALKRPRPSRPAWLWLRRLIRYAECVAVRFETMRPLYPFTGNGRSWRKAAVCGMSGQVLTFAA